MKCWPQYTNNLLARHSLSQSHNHSHLECWCLHQTSHESPSNKSTEGEKPLKKGKRNTHNALQTWPSGLSCWRIKRGPCRGGASRRVSLAQFFSLSEIITGYRWDGRNQGERCSGSGLPPLVLDITTESKCAVGSAGWTLQQSLRRTEPDSATKTQTNSAGY